jgi:hypothetical protein
MPLKPDSNFGYLLEFPKVKQADRLNAVPEHEPAKVFDVMSSEKKSLGR